MLTSTINPYPVDHENSAASASGKPNPKLHRRKTQSEDLNILAHAQGQLRSHLEPPESQTYQHQSQEAQPQTQLQRPWPQYPGPAPRPRSAQQFPDSQFLDPDLRPLDSHLPFRWWERGLLSSLSSHSDDEGGGEIRQSIERDPTASVVESIEIEGRTSPLPGGPKAKREAVETDEEARIWNEAQRNWNGYVQHKESWVRRAGLKREREGGERVGAAKRGRARG